MSPLASLPSPPYGVVHLGPLPLRAYAACILLGVLAAVVIAERRWVARGGQKGVVADIASIGVPVALVGARLYHVVTSPARYLKDPVAALYIWQGGLGIWGGVLAGGLAAAYLLRKRGLSVGAFADVVAPALPVAQAIGRFGNYFNQELFGRPTTLPWGLRIDPAHRPVGYGQYSTFHPTFLYESLWDLGVAGLVLWADRRWRLGGGRAFALYVAAYCVGRGWIEALRIDDANHLFGLRLNDYVSVVVFGLAVAFLVVRRGAGPDERADLRPVDVPLSA